MNEQKSTEASYDIRMNRWSFWLELNLRIRGLIFRTLIEKYLDSIPKLPDWVVVDLWSNAGYKIPSLLRAFPERKIIWIDNHSPSIQKWKVLFAGNSKVQMRVWNAMKLQDSVVEKVSLIFTSQMLHHFDFAERMMILKETIKTLLPGGILLVSDTFIDKDSILGNLLKTGYKHIAKSDAYHNIPPEQMKSEWEEIGYDFISRHDTTSFKKVGFYPSSLFVFQKPLEQPM